MSRLTTFWTKHRPDNSRSPSPRFPSDPIVQPSHALASKPNSKSASGPEVIGAGEGAVVADVIFVHGLRGDKIETWSKGDVCWPRDILGKDIKQIRIITWGYDSSVVNAFAGSSQASIFGHSEDLLTDIASRSLRPGAIRSRPIIFVGHSLGGIVIKQALIRSAQYSHNKEDSHLGSVYEHTLGVIFLGTPHRGSSQANFAQIISNIINMSGKRSNSKLLQALEKDSTVLEDQRRSFASISNKMRIVCAYEEIPMSVGIIVPEDSAVLDGFKVKKISVPADHSDICKFSDSRDIGYRRISDQIMAYIEDVVSLHASTSPGGTQNPQEYVVVHHDDPSCLSSQSMTASLDALTLLDTQETQSLQDSQSVDDQDYQYRIRFEIVNNSQDQFRVIDKALRDPSIDKWTNLPDMNLKLNMTGSGRSGSILFKNDTVPELFSVAAGVHNYHPWCDIITDLPDEAKASEITLSYYQSRSGKLWENLTKYETTSSQGTFISLVISDSWDGTYVAKVTILKETSIVGLDYNRELSYDIDSKGPNMQILAQKYMIISSGFGLVNLSDGY